MRDNCLKLYVNIGAERVYFKGRRSSSFPSGPRWFLGMDREMLAKAIGAKFTLRIRGDNCLKSFTVNDVYAEYQNSKTAGIILGGILGMAFGPIGTLIGCVIGCFLAAEIDSEINVPAKQFNESTFSFEKNISS